MKYRGIQLHMIRVTLLPLLLLALVLEAFFLYGRFADLDLQLRHKSRVLVQQLAANSEYAVFSGNQSLLSNMVAVALQQPEVAGVMVLDAQHKLLIHKGEVSGVLQAFPHTGSRELSLFEQQDSLYLYQPILPQELVLDELAATEAAAPLGMVVIHISKQEINRFKQDVLWFTLLALALLLSIALYLVYCAGRQITRPIRQLSQAVVQIGRGDLDSRIEINSQIEEVRLLVDGMNRMTALLHHERSILQQRIAEATVELRQQKDKAELASQEKSRFLAVASHDLRQPLHALGLYVAELQRKSINSEQRNLVQKVDLSVEVLTTLLNSLLDMSKLDAGAISPQCEVCVTQQVLQRLSSDFEAAAREKNIRLRVRACEYLVVSDRLLLERILVNLVSNAIRYTPINGTVLVACRRQEKFLRIEVRDNGVGIPESEQQNVFRAFVQLKQGSLGANKGLGLGLAIVQRLVDLLGHQISLRSQPGKGSVVALTIPLAEEGALPSPPVNLPLMRSTHLPGKVVLMVDDDETVRNSTRQLLESWGCCVLTALSFAEAKALLATPRQLDLVISDYQLGSIETGLDVLAAAKLSHPGIACLLVSGETAESLIQMAKQQGVALLHKPVKPAKLRSLVAFLLEKSASLDKG